jgi:signal peptidase I
LSGGKQSRGKLTYLRYLLYLLPVILIVLGYVGLIYYTGEPTPFTIVTGTSMQPTILAGSIAVLDHIPFDQLKLGEIIVFTPAEALSGSCDSAAGPSLTSEANGAPCFVIHRIVNITTGPNGQEEITTKGDNNPMSYYMIDYPIYQSQYVGVVVLQLPIAGYATQPPYNEYIGLLLAGLFIFELVHGREPQKKATQVASPS